MLNVPWNITGSTDIWRGLEGQSEYRDNNNNVEDVISNINTRNKYRSLLKKSGQKIGMSVQVLPRVIRAFEEWRSEQSRKKSFMKWQSTICRLENINVLQNKLLDFVSE